jgi:putative addiction module component (TIGR02574 family)
MAKTVDNLAAEIHGLPDVEKLQLVDTVLAEMDRPDPEIDRVWAEESRKRWAAYKAGQVKTVPYETVRAKHRRLQNAGGVIV